MHAGIPIRGIPIRVEHPDPKEEAALTEAEKADEAEQREAAAAGAEERERESLRQQLAALKQGQREAHYPLHPDSVKINMLKLEFEAVRKFANLVNFESS